jgi:hypothetical protein
VGSGGTVVIDVCTQLAAHVTVARGIAREDRTY